MIEIKYQNEKLISKAFICLGIIGAVVLFMYLDIVGQSQRRLVQVLAVLMIIGNAHHAWAHMKRALGRQSVVSVSGQWVTVNTLYEAYAFPLTVISSISIEKLAWGDGPPREHLIIDLSERVKPKFHPISVLSWIFGTTKILVYTRMLATTSFELANFTTDVMNVISDERPRQNPAASQTARSIKLAEGDDRFADDAIISKHIQQTQGIQPQIKPVFGRKKYLDRL
jgi:hypothetical protein